eukprot:CAMPEP_0194121322 /NCGR_PEP_ID=MMETSP0150-20130528/46598_1 /TAXON_ID=122233 /ORGANISM="Chaetoceros debilis, Strain MM31A-1" /LENGTH=430 /DNA_ID=CAMNT_0038813703 /DNA_START=79 /DNA_END=1368 /DNA_ORIENTATION=-
MLFSRVLLLAILTLQGGDPVGAFAPSGVLTDSGREALVASNNNAKSSNAAAIDERHNYATASSSLSLSTVPTESEDFNISELLNKALKGDTEAASTVLDKIGAMRQEGAQEDMTNLLNTILGLTDAEKMPFWTKFRITSKLSKRSRLVSLHRVLNISTPAPSSDGEDTEEAKQDRRRRAVVVALRSIVNASDNEEEEQSKSTSKGLSISRIEKLARKDLKQNVSSEDMKSRIPEGLETPKYDVIAKRPTFEIREYESFSVCSVPMMKSRPDAATTDRKVSQPQLAGASSFGALAGYLFGKNEEQKAMKMTTPVLTTGEGDQKEMAFVLPSEYWDSGNADADADALSKAPSPLENSLVQLKKNEGGQRAVSMFGGFASSKEVEAKKKELLAKLASDSEWKPVDDAAVALAQYNDPFTPPWKRLSEVSVPVS